MGVVTLCAHHPSPIAPRSSPFVLQTFIKEETKMSKLSILSEFWGFMRVRKKWWLGPIVLVMLMLSLLIILTQGSALAPFIYTLF
jgi:hypothetical protein